LTDLNCSSIQSWHLRIAAGWRRFCVIVQRYHYLCSAPNIAACDTCGGKRDTWQAFGGGNTIWYIY
jgi:hypothetical protein